MLGNLVRPLTHSVLYLHMLLNKARLKPISRRTSYLRVRLEFLRYPQVIRILFNEYRFGPPLDFTPASTCSWIGHSVSGLLHDTIIFALFRLGFPSAAYLTQYLTSHHTHNSPDRSTKSTISSLNALYLLVNIGFQVLFHSPSGVLFNFPSRYYFTIGYQGVFSLGQWSGLLQTGFLVSRPTLDSTSPYSHFAYEAFTLSGVLSQNTSAMIVSNLIVVLNPKSITTSGLGFSDFARHYFRNRFLFLFLKLLRCFSSLRFTYHTLFYSCMYTRVLSLVGSPIQISVGHWIFAPHHSFSQLITSFFVSWCLGIHPTLLLA